MCRRATWKAAAARSPGGGYSRDGKKDIADCLRPAVRSRRLSRCHRGVREPAPAKAGGNTADPMTLATQIDKLKQRFNLDPVVLVGDRGMVTQARITEDIKSAGLDWISSLRAPAIRELVEGGVLQLSLFDQRDMASITAPDFPGERLVVCRNPDLAAQRTRKREDLLAATERDLAPIQASRGAKARSAARNRRDRARGRQGDQPAQDGQALRSRYHRYRRCAATNPSPSWNAPFAASRPSICTFGRSITGWPIGSARMSSSACWPITWNGTCVSASLRRCSTIPTRKPPKHCAQAWWRRRSAHRPRFRSRPQEMSQDGLPVHSFQSLLADLATIDRNTVTTAITPNYPLSSSPGQPPYSTRRSNSSASVVASSVGPRATNCAAKSRLAHSRSGKLGLSFRSRRESKPRSATDRACYSGRPACRRPSAIRCNMCSERNVVSCAAQPAIVKPG